MNIPTTLKYTKDHEWIKVEENSVTIGITDFAQQELGDIVYVDIETKGQEISQEEIFGCVEAVKTVSDLFMPVSGTIIEVNEGLENTPEIVNSDPYEEGWLIKVALSNKNELDDLLSDEAYKQLIGIS